MDSILRVIMAILDAIWTWLSGNINNIILLLLGFDTIRVIIGAMRIVDEDKHGCLSNIIYGKRRPSTIKAALRDLGYSEIKSDEYSSSLSNKAISKQLSRKDNLWCYRELIKLLRRCIIKCDKKVTYGNNTTEYYIDTMSGVDNEDNREIMRELMIYLLKAHGKLKPKFVITPKNGNPTFGASVCSLLGPTPLLLHKHKEDPSRVKPIESESKVDTAQPLFRVNFEGSAQLNINDKQEGIIIDCNTSTGTQIQEAAKEFEELIVLQGAKDGHCPIVKSAFVLFRVDDDPDLDRQFKESGIKLNCILMLSENIKQKIYDELSSNPSDTEIETIINVLKENGYLLLPKPIINRKTGRNNRHNKPHIGNVSTAAKEETSQSADK